MRRAAPALQEALVDGLRSVVTSFGDRPPSLPSLDPGYLVPMLVHAARQHGNHIVDHVPAYSSADHQVNWYCLVSALARVEGFTDPYFHFGASTDPAAEEVLRAYHSLYLARHQLASLEMGHWELFINGSGIVEIGLTPPARRSALHLVANQAERYMLPDEVGQILDEPFTDETRRRLVEASRHASLAVLRESDPDAWGRLSAGIGFDLDELPTFQACLIDLADLPPAWYSQDELFEIWNHYRQREAPQTSDAFAALVACHSISPDEALSWSATAPLLRCGDHYIPWFFGFHGMHPDLVFLTLLIRRHEQLWSQTVGSTLARAADWLGRRLNCGERIKWRARVAAPDGVGDADLVLLDTTTAHVAVFELKTTFDKFRTSFQMRNFVEQRVGYARALKQAEQAAQALRSGAWPLRSVFGKGAPERPTEVTAGVLTWWDTYNPTAGSLRVVPICNYATLAYILDRAHGDLEATIATIKELTGIYCPARLVTISEASETTDRILLEVQSASIPPVSSWPDVTDFTRNLLEDHRHWPEDWKDRQDEGRWRIYPKMG
ncbi:hypothetical protein [Micromonospora palythoicola]|uniref:hypothetical protein n=1 Tax=Micromonospora palythoicola TaxID=3120507 RepID=UPI002FCE1261